MLSQEFLFFLILRKTGEKRVLTHVMPFLEPHRHERHHISKLLAWAVIIFMDESNNKHFKGEERVSHDVFQNNYDELVDNSTPFYFLNHYIRCKTKGFSGGIYFH